MDQFEVTNTSLVKIKVVKGTIAPEDNELGDEYKLFYWANFIPHFDKKIVIIIGECGFDTICEKKTFAFEYNIETDTVSVSNYRTCLCTPELYNKYYLNFTYADKSRNYNAISIPWIRFPRTKDGIAIPKLIEQIFGRMPQLILFE